MVSRSIEWKGHGATLFKRASSWLTGTAFTGAFVTVVAAFPQSALAACLGENTGSVTCDAANPASGGTLNSSFGGTTVVTVNPGAQIDTGGATVTVTAAGSLTFTNGDTTYGIPNGVSLTNNFGGISYIGNAATSGVFAQGTDGAISIVNRAMIGLGGIAAGAAGDGSITINSAADVNGNIGGTAGGAGDVLVSSTGAVSGQISAASMTGNAGVTGSGSVTSTAFGIAANTGGAGNATVSYNGTINSADTALFASSVNGNAAVTGSGGLTSASSLGAIFARASGNGNALVAWNGAVTQTGTGNGLIAMAGAGSATINVLGNVTANPTFSGNIEVTTVSGLATASVAAGLTIGGGSIGIDAETISGNVHVDVGAGASVSGSTAAINVSSVSGLSNTTIGAGANISGGSVAGIFDEGGGSLTIGNGAVVTATGPSAIGVVVGTTANYMLFNAGSITGSMAAIYFIPGSGLNTLTLAPTSVISGLVIGSASPLQTTLSGHAPGAADTFQLGGTGTGTFDVSRIGDAAQYSGFGTFNKVDSSIWILTGKPGQTTSWSIIGGELSVANDISLGAANEALSFNGGLLQVTGTSFTATPRSIVWGAGGGGFDIADPTNVFTVSQALGAGGALTKTGAGTLILSGANAYSGTIVNAGTLRLAGAGTLGDLGGALTVNGGLLDLGGTTQIQNGGLTLTGGTIANGALSSSGTFNLQAGTLDAVLTGTGNLLKSGAGTFVLDGVQLYTGLTTVDAGSLSVNGDVTASSVVTVNAGGTLGGNGTLGNTLINGGALSPGNTIGMLTINGSLTMTAASTYLVQISGASSDKVVVSGAATVGGKVTVDPLARLNQTATYEIINAGTLSGTFGDTSITNNLARNARLSYLGSEVFLTLDPGLLSPILPGNAGINQKNVASGIDNALIGGASLPTGFNTLFMLSGDALLNALTQISGETATGSQQTTLDAMNLFMGLMSDPFSAGRGGAVPAPFAFSEDDALAYASDGRKRTRTEREAYAMFTKAPPRAYEARWNVWAAGFGGSRTTDGNATLGANRATGSIAGGAVGADYWFSPFTVAGIALAGGGTSFSVAGGGSGQSDLFQAGAFVRHSVASAYITATAAYGWQDISTDRMVTAVGAERLRANFDANAYSGRIEGGNRWLVPQLGGVGLTPYAAVQVTAFDLPAYSETSVNGAGGLALDYAGKTVTATRSEIGLRGDKSWGLAEGLLTLRGRAAWAHDYTTDRNVGAVFQSLPGSAFTVNGASAPGNAAFTSASAEMSFTNGWSVAATFDGEFSDISRSYAGKGVVRHAW